MTFYTPRPGVGPQTAFVFDANSLKNLQARVVKDPGGTQPTQEVAKQFEALFIQMLLKQARQANSALGGSLYTDHGTQMAQSMGDEQLALSLASSKNGLGIADRLLEQITMQTPNFRQEDLRFAPKGVDSLVDPLAALGGDRPDEIDSIGQLIELLNMNANKKAEQLKERRLNVASNAPASVASFIERLEKPAQKVAAKTGLPVELILSQAALESGWGKREIRHPDGSPTYNLFGIKATGWSGKKAEAMTTEFVNGKPLKRIEAFRAYDSYEHALSDYARLLTQNKRYAKVVQAANAKAAAHQVQAAGYATDPQYAQKLIRIMSYFDTSNTSSTPAG